jgi:hypothetical protein
VFAADDALAFSYEALPVLAKKTVLTAASGLRGMLRKGLAGAERPAGPDPHDTFEREPSPVPGFQPEEPQVDLEDAPQPTRKLRDLIQAAVKSNMAGSAAPGESTSWGSDSGTSRGNDRALPRPDDEVYPKLESSDPVWSESNELSSDSRQEVHLIVEPYVEKASVADLTEISHDRTQSDRATLDLSPVFAEPGASDETINRPRPGRGLFDPEPIGLENGDTLGERPAEPFGWVRAAEVAIPPASPGETPSHVARSLDALIDEVRNGGMSPAQVGAVTDLINAVVEAIQDKNRR